MARLGNFWRQFTGWLSNLWRRFFGWLTVPRAVALLLGLLGVLIGVGGYLYRYCACQEWPSLVAGWEQLFLDFYANVATTLVGITVAVLTIDLLNERRADKHLKAQLIREMANPDNGIALRAVSELWAHRWTIDGSLRRAWLSRANLERADLSRTNLQMAQFTGANLQRAYLVGANLQMANLLGADLQGADLTKANLQDAVMCDTKLQGADLTKANLQGAALWGVHSNRTGYRVNAITEVDPLDWRRTFLLGEDFVNQRFAAVLALQGATMADGTRYDGRFNLRGDIETAIHFHEVKPDDPEAMARFYSVPLEAYLAGQEWARKNLPRLRREAGLDQGEAVEMEDIPQSEELQSAAASSSAHTSPVAPAQSLLSFTVRRLIGLFWPFGL